MSTTKSDVHFDGLADKFAANIYGTTKGQLRHRVLIHALTKVLESPSQTVIEVGGGTGLMTKVFLEAGHDVVFTDASAEILEHAKLNLDGMANVAFRHQQLQEVSDFHQFDIIVCHAVLEWLHAPLDTLSLMLNQMKPGSRLSLSFFNYDATLFTNALYGNFDYIAQGMKVKNQVKLNPKNPLRPMHVIEHVKSEGLVVEQVTGVRCFHDYMKVKPDNEEQLQKLLELELQHCQQAPFKWLGKYVHLLIRKPH
ncbi:methyltransferase domain-containing protein [Alteromonas sp. ASW11-130]|uniref:methyltransferase domain-containing protein n=1 Tax=Alteromonas sp. ASW11-130 TaxID=3015775 RepID=UPI0022426BB3|nr:methyltransferase domain-containing protein [Alteromonas sp. ASW11-130]MCW8092210.1 methyltransferase domain-containing protein [Alteromonas sp. ASW11-130]